jgi:hypothetical protein
MKYIICMILLSLVSPKMPRSNIEDDVALDARGQIAKETAKHHGSVLVAQVAVDLWVHVKNVAWGDHVETSILWLLDGARSILFAKHGHAEALAPVENVLDNEALDRVKSVVEINLWFRRSLLSLGGSRFDSNVCLARHDKTQNGPSKSKRARANKQEQTSKSNKDEL